MHNILVYSITPVFLLLSIYLIFKTRKDYKNFQKRSKCTSTLSVLYHELFVVLACYSTWFSTWPFLNLNSYLYIHYIFFIIGLFPLFLGLIVYIMYMLRIKSIPRAMGLNSDKLITGGIYSISRNPQSLGRGIGLIGIAIMGRSFFTLYLALIWILINHFIIIVEEKYLEEIFGELYIQYLALTPRYYKVNNKKKLS